MILDAAVIVVTYNHAAHIGPCLESLTALEPAPAELIVIDNGSRDGTPALIRRDFPEVRLIEAGANLGFAGGCNLGARATNAGLIVLANPDLIVPPEWLELLLRPFERDDGIAIVGGKLRYPNGRIQHAGGAVLLPLGLSLHHGVGAVDCGQHDAMIAVDYVTGATLAVRRAIWDELEGMDEQFYPAYYEEVDFCTRARKAGGNIVYNPAAVAQHSEGSGIGHGSDRYLRLYHLNRLRYLFKHFNDPWLMRTWLPAELGHIRAVASDSEVAALQAVYLTWQSVFCGLERQTAISDLDLFPDATALGGETELQWVERQLAAKAQVAPQPVQSRWPLIAGLRNGMLRLATADYVRGIVQAQNDTNAALYEAVRALARQRRAADAAALLQGMVLAKIMAAQRDQ